MVNIHQAVFSALTFAFPSSQPPPPPNDVPTPSKSIAIVGAGSAGLAMLYTLLEFPPEVRKDWDIILYEQHRDVGGVWVPDLNPPLGPPDLPETPLYPLLRTNTPVPTMTYPNFTFPPRTPLYPRHQHVRAYHRRFANTFGLDQHIAYNHSVLSAAWTGNETVGQWKVTVRNAANETTLKTFDHIVSATGNNHFPRIVTFRGQEEWLANSPSAGPKREIQHSVWYKGPERYANRTVVVVGSGASGRDAGVQVATTARKVYQSQRDDYEPPSNLGIILKPEIAHFTANTIVFVDGSVVDDVDALILGTGYQVRVPFLEAGSAVAVDPSARGQTPSNDSLTTNLRYLFPLHRHIVSLCPSHPPGALTFIGLPILVANCPSDRAQSLFVAHIIKNASLLPPREELLEELRVREDELRAGGWDPYWVGHRLVSESSWDYQDAIVRFLKERGAMADDGRPYVEPWRREVGDWYLSLRRAWARVEELGTEDEWLEGVESEEEWADPKLNRDLSFKADQLLPSIRMPSKVVISKEEWEHRLHKVDVSKDDLNRLIMDYLVIEGYKCAAEEFSAEARMSTPIDFGSIESRMDIREALQRGDVEEAIARVNDLNPEILDTNPALYFHLQQQKLIEHIRAGRTAEALAFAQAELAPRGEESPEFLGELERTMALLAFESAPGEIGELLGGGQRMKTAGEVNAAILESLRQGREVKLVGLLKLMRWGEGLLDERAEFPRMHV